MICYNSRLECVLLLLVEDTKKSLCEKLHPLFEIEVYIRRGTVSISREELRRLSRGIISRSKACLLAGCWQIETLQANKVRWRKNTKYKLPAEAGFLFDDALAAAAVLRPEIKDTPCIIKSWTYGYITFSIITEVLMALCISVSSSNWTSESSKLSNKCEQFYVTEKLHHVAVGRDAVYIE